jgi:hypothetical protein
VGCYAVSTKPGDSLTITLQPSNFDGEIRIARGALCNANALQARRSWTGAQAVELSIPAAGGRYLILVERTPGAGGRFTLVANGNFKANATPTEAPLVAPEIENKEPPPEPVSARRQLMLAQVAQRRVELAQAAERARRDEEERRIQEQRARREQAARCRTG